MEGMDSIRPNYRKHKTNEYKVLSEKIDGDAAFVKYKEKGDEKEQTIKLKKEDGKWLVAFSKADMKGKGEIMNKEDEPFEMDAKMDKDSAKVDTGTVK